MKRKTYYWLMAAALWILSVQWAVAWFRMPFMMELGPEQVLERGYTVTLAFLCWVTGTLFSRLASEKS